MVALAANALLLADGRFPSGGHAHSGTLEAAVAVGSVIDVETLGAFLEGRLWTSGLTAAGLAAAACAGRHPWRDLDGEANARISSPALRASSRQQGRQLLRAGRATWGGPRLDRLAAEVPRGAHHPVALGAVAAAAGLIPVDAARNAAYAAVAGPAGAAVRLLGLDPFAVQALLARLAPEVEGVVAESAGAARGPAAPLLDVLAEEHDTWEVRLFAS
jgi:urease accessory protein